MDGKKLAIFDTKSILISWKGGSRSLIQFSVKCFRRNVNVSIMFVGAIIKKVDNAALETINIKPRVGGKALNCDLKDTILALILMG